MYPDVTNAIAKRITRSLTQSHIVHSLIIYILFSIFSIYEAPPTAELEPLSDGKVAQTDEVLNFELYY